jgi:hypothetical protein
VQVRTSLADDHNARISEWFGNLKWRFAGDADGAPGGVCGLDQLHPLQTRMPVLADDDVVMHGDAERRGDIDDRLCHLDIGL